MKCLKVCLTAMFIFAFVTSSAVLAGTLDDVKAKGYIQAGVNGDLFGFGKPDEKGEWKGLDVDTARQGRGSRRIW